MSGRKQEVLGAMLSARQIADDLGVSVSTVTRAFNAGANVAPRTRERILAHAKSLGYSPNVFASTLNTQRTRIATIFISDFYNPFFAEALVTLTEELQNAGLSVMLYHIAPGRTAEETLPEALRYRPEFIVVMTATVTFQRAIASAGAGPHHIGLEQLSGLAGRDHHREAGDEVGEVLAHIHLHAEAQQQVVPLHKAQAVVDQGEQHDRQRPGPGEAHEGGLDLGKAGPDRADEVDQRADGDGADHPAAKAKQQIIRGGGHRRGLTLLCSGVRRRKVTTILR